MNSEQEICDLLDEISNDFDDCGELDVNLANQFIEKLINLSIDEPTIDQVGETFANIYNGNHHTELDDDTAAESAKANLFVGIRKMLSKAFVPMGKNSSMTTTQSVTSHLRIATQGNGTKVLIWDFNWTKTKTPTQKVIHF